MLGDDYILFFKDAFEYPVSGTDTTAIVIDLERSACKYTDATGDDPYYLPYYPRYNLCKGPTDGVTGVTTYYRKNAFSSKDADDGLTTIKILAEANGGTIDTGINNNFETNLFVDWRNGRECFCLDDSAD